MRSGQIPKRTHQADSRLRPPRPTEANGLPLSVRMASGKPRSRNSRSIHGRTGAPCVLVNPRHSSRLRL